MCKDFNIKVVLSQDPPSIHSSLSPPPPPTEKRANVVYKVPCNSVMSFSQNNRMYLRTLPNTPLFTLTVTVTKQFYTVQLSASL